MNELSVPTEILARKLTNFGPPGFVLLASRVSDRLDAAMIAAGWTFRRTLEMMVMPRTRVPPHSPDDLNVVVELIDHVNAGDVIALSDLVFGSRIGFRSIDTWRAFRPPLLATSGNLREGPQIAEQARGHQLKGLLR